LRKLRADYGLDLEMPSMRCVGYRQTWEYLDGKIGLSALREQGIAATRQLAKRQLTWLRAMTEVMDFDCLADDLSDQVLAHLRQRLPASAAADKS
jgi:tRNA dimethylallyltransferase